MGNQDNNFTLFQDGRYLVLNVPPGSHEMNVWQQSHCLAMNSFDNLNLVLGVLETCRSRVAHIKNVVGTIHGTLPKSDQSPLPGGELRPASKDDNLNELRYRFEVARCTLSEMRAELLQAIVCLAAELKRSGLENPEHRPDSMNPTLGRLFKHHMSSALRELKLAKRDHDSASVYLDSLPQFPLDLDKVYAAASFDFKHMGV